MFGEQSHQSGSENTATPSMAKIGVVISCHHLFAVDAQLHTVHGSVLQYQDKLAGLNILNIMKIFCQSESRTRDKAKEKLIGYEVNRSFRSGG